MRAGVDVAVNVKTVAFEDMTPCIMVFQRNLQGRISEKKSIFHVYYVGCMLLQNKSNHL
jgi:hypothetical protein